MQSSTSAASRFGSYLWTLCAVVCFLLSSLAAASEYRGQVTFGGLPLPGATVIASRGDKKVVAITDPQGLYSFPDLVDGTWAIAVEMQCFAIARQDVVIAPNAPAAKWELTLLPLDQIKAQIQAPAPRTNPASPNASKPGPEEPKSAPPAEEPASQYDELAQRAADGLLINGSMNNGASSPFAQLAAFGNKRNSGQGLYNGGIGITADNSALDAEPFSLTGQNPHKPAYNDLSGVVTFGGPLRIPHLLEHGPVFFVAYQWMRNRDSSILPGIVPDADERTGNLSQALNAQGQPLQIFNPATGLPFAGNMIPVSPQAQALLNLYPLPNLVGNPFYNYQTPILTTPHQDDVIARLDKTIGRKNQVWGDFTFRSTRTKTPNLFAFVDAADLRGINSSIHWSHRFNQRWSLNAGYTFSRLATRVTPYWENRENVSADAGIAGNNQDPMNWGPPSLGFSSGIASLSDGQSAFDRNRTDAWSYAMLWNRDHHNLNFGGDFRKQQSNYLSQQDPRGTFTFTGAATEGGSGTPVGGSDLADFLLGIPDTSSIAFGNPDKYFRENVYDAFITDDWRVGPQLTVNAGIRWEYGAPITELKDRLVNLDIAPDFTDAAPVLATDPVGPLTGRHYPDSLIQPDRRAIEPRIGIAWRPISGSSMVVRAGYGIYSDTSVYQNIALQMAQQAPLSKSLNVENSPACPLTLASGFSPCSAITPDSFAIDPNFRVGYAQNWNLTIQRDLPGSLQLKVAYLGIKGTRGVQEFLPNTFPVGVVNPCPSCPIGFAYLTSGGNSTRQAGQIELRRRLHNGLTATVQYTFSKSIDDDAALGGQGASVSSQNATAFGASDEGSSGTMAGGLSICSVPCAQNWLDLRAERGLSTFDQRHLLNVQFQYTTGMGLGGKTLLTGWKGMLFKEWTFLSVIAAGSGLPQTPIYLTTVPGTGVTGTIRPDSTGAPLYSAPSGLFLNPAAYTVPPPGQWGDAGRDSIIGPAQFSLDAGMRRSFQLHDHFNLDFGLDSTNLLNHVTFTGWNTIINNAQFGLPSAWNQMRHIQASLRLRF